MRSSAGQVDETVDPAHHLSVQIATANVAVRGMAVIRGSTLDNQRQRSPAKERLPCGGLPELDLTYGQANSAPREALCSPGPGEANAHEVGQHERPSRFGKQFDV